MILARRERGGLALEVTPLTFGRARLHVGKIDAPVYLDEW